MNQELCTYKEGKVIFQIRLDGIPRWIEVCCELTGLTIDVCQNIIVAPLVISPVSAANKKIGRGDLVSNLHPLEIKLYDILCSTRIPEGPDAFLLLFNHLVLNDANGLRSFLGLYAPNYFTQFEECV